MAHGDLSCGVSGPEWGRGNTASFTARHEEGWREKNSWKSIAVLIKDRDLRRFFDRDHRDQLACHTSTANDAKVL